jgi:uncharacterized membrane protein YgaE (UPF0421/DUF939 family)
MARRGRGLRTKARRPTKWRGLATHTWIGIIVFAVALGLLSYYFSVNNVELASVFIGILASLTAWVFAFIVAPAETARALRLKTRLLEGAERRIRMLNFRLKDLKAETLEKMEEYEDEQLKELREWSDRYWKEREKREELEWEVHRYKTGSHALKEEDIEYNEEGVDEKGWERDYPQIRKAHKLVKEDNILKEEEKERGIT